MYCCNLLSVKVSLDLWKSENSPLSCLTEVSLLVEELLWTLMVSGWSVMAVTSPIILNVLTRFVFISIK